MSRFVFLLQLVVPILKGVASAFSSYKLQQFRNKKLNIFFLVLANSGALIPLSSHFVFRCKRGRLLHSGLKSMRKVCVISYFILKCMFHAIMNPYLLPVSKDFKVEMAPVCSLASSEVSCLQAEGDMEYKNLCKEGKSSELFCCCCCWPVFFTYFVGSVLGQHILKLVDVSLECNDAIIHLLQSSCLFQPKSRF